VNHPGGETDIFCASDAAKALEYVNPYAAVKRHCRGHLTKREGVVQKVNQYGDAGGGPPMLILMLLTGLYLTCGTRFFQIRRFCYTIKNTVAAIFKDRKVTKTKDEKAISQFQALATALAATVGTGNIVGVATAISSGGAGAVFWMWISALLGMMTSFSENALGIYFRRKNE
jgi:Na+/alanine symporter